MSKRFIDTGLFDDSWFMELSKDAKLLWIYMITRCDHAGIIELNKRLVTFQTGIEDLNTSIKELSNRLVTLNKELTVYFIPKFIFFQYPNFPQSNVKQQQGAIKQLEKYSLFKEGKLTLTKELPNSYGNDNGNGNEEKGVQGEKQFYSNSDSIHFYDMDKVELEMINSESWHEHILRLNPSLTKTRLLREISTFCLEQKASANESKCFADYKRHFIKWIALMLRNENKGVKPAAPSRPANVQKYIDQLAEKEK